MKDDSLTRRPTLVRWGPPDGKPAGVSAWPEGDERQSVFCDWADFKRELETMLLPQLFAEPSGFHFHKRDHHGKADWLVWVVDARGDRYCDVWLGVNPEKGWSFDGLVHLGNAETTPHVWQSYQRYSDGTYRRLPSLVSSLDQHVIGALKPSA